MRITYFVTCEKKSEGTIMPKWSTFGKVVHFGSQQWSTFGKISPFGINDLFGRLMADLS